MPRLDACLIDDAAHITLRTPPEKGEHVSLIQAALFLLMPNVNLEDELGTEEYGPLTAAAVFRFKDTRRPKKILNKALHQTVPDKVSRPGESHPQALAEPYLNVSAHTAPIIQPWA